MPTTRTTLALRRRPVGRTIAVLALALTLGACAAEPPRPAPIDDVRADATPTPSPTPSTTEPEIPTLPRAARGTTPKAAEALVRYAFETVDFSRRTLNVRPFEQIITTNCGRCDSLIAKVRDVKRRGGHFERGGYRVLEVEFLSVSDQRRPEVRVYLQLRRGKEYRSANSKPVAIEPGDYFMSFNVVRSRGDWKIDDFRTTS